MFRHEADKGNTMAREKSQKAKILKLYEILRLYSTAEDPLTTPKILEFLNKEGIPCDRRTVYTDVETLQQYGFPVVKTKVKNASAYYLEKVF